MATKTITITNLSSKGVTLSNIKESVGEANGGSYTTPSCSKNGGSHRAQIDIDLYEAFGLYGSVSSVTIKYTVYGSRTSWAQGTVDTGYYHPNSGDVYTTHNGTKIGRGSKNATNFEDETWVNVYNNKVSLIMKFINEIALLDNTFTVSNVSITLVIEETYIPINTSVSPTGSGKVVVSGNNHVGSTVNLTATPNDGYKFTQWQDGNTSNPRSVAITIDYANNTPTYTACFEKLPPEFTSAEMKYLDKQISNTNKVIAGESFVISVGVT